MTVLLRSRHGQIRLPGLLKGDIVIRDNLGSHKGACLRKAIAATGAEATLCSALQLRVQIRSKTHLKPHLRKAAGQLPRTSGAATGGLLSASQSKSAHAFSSPPRTTGVKQSG